MNLHKMKKIGGMIIVVSLVIFGLMILIPILVPVWLARMWRIENYKFLERDIKSSESSENNRGIN